MSNGDSIFAVTVLSHVAVTPLLIHNELFSCKYVTDDSKFPLFKISCRVFGDYIATHFCAEINHPIFFYMAKNLFNSMREDYFA